MTIRDIRDFLDDGGWYSYGDRIGVFAAGLILGFGFAYGILMIAFTYEGLK